MGGAKAAKAARRQAREQTARMSFWHGGISGLQVGDLILPPTATRSGISTSQLMDEARPDRVYIATDRELARTFAAIIFEHLGAGDLYRVQPIGEIRTDPDYPACSFEARQARILAVDEIDVQLTSTERVQRTAKYMTWDDGRPMYDSAGRIQLTWQMESAGITQYELNTQVPRWSTWEQATVAATRILQARAWG